MAACPSWGGLRSREVRIERSARSQKMGIIVTVKLVISGVQPGSPAMGHVEVGEKVLMVNDVDVGTQDEFRNAVVNASNNTVKLRLLPVDFLEPPEPHTPPVNGPPLPRSSLLANDYMHADSFSSSSPSSYMESEGLNDIHEASVREVLMFRPSNSHILGLTLSQGLIVCSVQSGFPASGFVAVGERITAVNGIPVSTGEEFQNVLQASVSKQVWLQLMPQFCATPGVPPNGSDVKPAPSPQHEGDAAGGTPFIGAQEEDMGVLKKLIQQEVDIDKEAHTGVTGTNVTREFDADVVKSQLPNQADINKARRDVSILAAQMGCADVVKEPTWKQADINKARRDGSIPIFVASQTRHTDVAKRTQADINKARHDGNIPTFSAAQQGRTDVAKGHLADDVHKATHDCSTPMRIASQERLTGNVMKPIQNRSQVPTDKEKQDGTTPTLVAIGEKRTDDVKEPIPNQAKIKINLASSIPTLTARESHTKVVMKSMFHQDDSSKAKTNHTSPTSIGTNGVEKADINKAKQDDTTLTFSAPNKNHSSAATSKARPSQIIPMPIAAGWGHANVVENPVWNQAVTVGLSVLSTVPLAPAGMPLKGAIVLNCEDIGRNAARCPAFQTHEPSRVSWQGVERAIAYYEEHGFDVHCVCKQATAQKWPPPPNLDRKLVCSPELDYCRFSDQLFTIRLAQTYKCSFVDNSSPHPKSGGLEDHHKTLQSFGGEGSQIAYLFDCAGCFLPLHSP